MSTFRSFRYMPMATTVLLSLDRGVGRADLIQIAVHSDGLVSLSRIYAEAEARQRVQERLDEWGVVEWRQVGPGESEMYLTTEWRDRLTAQLLVLGGWRDLPDPEGVES